MEHGAAIPRGLRDLDFGMDRAVVGGRYAGGERRYRTDCHQFHGRTIVNRMSLYSTFYEHWRGG
jgi:hypothetical protein